MGGGWVRVGGGSERRRRTLRGALSRFCMQARAFFEGARLGVTGYHFLASSVSCATPILPKSLATPRLYAALAHPPSAAFWNHMTARALRANPPS